MTEGPGALPEVRVEGPFHGRKLARLAVVEGVPRLVPLHERPGAVGWYAPMAVARCEAGHDHPAPDPACSCGFWAVRDEADLDRLGGWTGERVALHVRLGGRIVEAEHGFRAAQQAVDRVLVPDTCARCDRPAVAMGAGRWRRQALRPQCHRHRSRRSWGLDALADALGTTVVAAPRVGGAPASELRRARLAGALPPCSVAVVLAVLAVVLDAAPIASVGVAALAAWPLLARTRRRRRRAVAARAESSRSELDAAWSAATAAATLAGWTLLGLVAAGLAPPL